MPIHAPQRSPAFMPSTLKLFYASDECVERGLDPLAVNEDEGLLELENGPRVAWKWVSALRGEVFCG